MRRLFPLLLIASPALIACSGSEPTAPVEEEQPHQADPAQVVPAVWFLRSDHTLRTDIQRALARARERNTKVLLEFGADWCPDCNEVARLGDISPAKEVIEANYERVFIHVGRFDRHEDLMTRYRIDRIATLVILSGDGRRVAQTTLEPISSRTGLTAEAFAEWLRNPRDEWRRPEPSPGTPPPDDSPIFPADLPAPE